MINRDKRGGRVSNTFRHANSLFYTPRKRQGSISQLMTLKTVRTYVNARPIIIGLFAVLFSVVVGMSVAFAVGFATPTQVMAQVFGPPCCIIPPPPPPPLPPPPPPPPPVVEAPPVIGPPCCTAPLIAPSPPPPPPVISPVLPPPPEPPAPLFVPPIIPPSPPVPTCTLSASPTSLPYSGGSSTLSWTSAAATIATIDNGVGAVSPVGAGSQTISVTTTTNYTMTVSGPGGQTTCAAEISVESPPPPPSVPTCTLSALPSSIQSMGTSTLSWTTTEATFFTIDNGVDVGVSVSAGSATVSPATTTTYTGTATSPIGSVYCSAVVTVLTDPPIPDVPTCTLSASPTSVDSGNSTTLSWTTTNATTFSIDHGVATTTPASGGSISSGVLISDTTFTGTATSATGVVATCSAPVSINHGGGGSAPSCLLTVSPTSYVTGNSATLSWGGERISTVDIDNSIATATSSPGSVTVSPAGVGSHTYTGTFHAQNGQTLTCATTLTVTGGGGGGGGGCTGNCGGGGGGGGGGSLPPTITLAALPHMGVQPLAYLYLSQIPYTGLDLGPVGTVFYWLALVGFALALAYFILFISAPFLHQYLRNFSARVLAVLNARETSSVVVPSPALSSEVPKPLESSSEYSSHLGFKSFAQNGALSVEDIVKSLSRNHSALPVDKKIVESIPNVEPIHEHVEPVYEHVEPIEDSVSTKSDTRPISIRGLVAALIEGDRAEVFASLRQHVRNGGTPEQLISTVACSFDDVYRSRVDGTVCDPDISRLSARLSTPTLEKFISALTTAIDSSYVDRMTGAKLALTRALTVLGA